MAEIVLLNVKQYVAGLDLSGSYNQHALVIDADAPEVSAFGDLTRVYLGGLKGAGSEHEGFFDGPIDDDLFDAIGAAARLTTITPTDDDGEVAYFFETIGTSYSPGGSIGEAFAFSNSNQVTGLVTRGLVLSTGAKSSDGDGTARQLGAVASGKVMRAALHVLAIAGTGTPTLDVTVESDNAQAFSDPTTQITFTQATAAGSELKTKAGAVTDDWWRVSYDLGATTTSATFVVAAGIS